MLIFLYILNSVLALVFLAAGLNKVSRPKASLSKMGLAWVDDMPAAAVKAIGGIEVIGAIGLILPLALNTAAILTPIAAVALAIVMVAAALLHIRRQESFAFQSVLTILLLASAVFGFLQIAS